MKLYDVESSNVASIGYDSDRGVAGVLFKDGAYYEAACSHDAFTELSFAPSKGKFIAEHFRGKLTRASRDVALPVSQAAVAPEKLALDTFAEDAECGGHIIKACQRGELKNVDSWICSHCGQEWRARQVSETIRHWAPHESIEVF